MELHFPERKTINMREYSKAMLESNLKPQNYNLKINIKRLKAKTVAFKYFSLWKILNIHWILCVTVMLKVFRVRFYLQNDI